MGVSLTVKLVSMSGMKDVPDMDNMKSVDVRFHDYPHESRDFFKNYYLFSWLAKATEGIKPREDVDRVQNSTYEIFKMLDSLRKEIDGKQIKQSLIEYLGFEQNSYILYGVKVLRSFDYDQVQVMEDGSLQPDGYTYRDQFENDLLPLLDYAYENDFTHILFGFES